MAVGAASVLSPAYISEVAPASIRGRLTTVQQIMIITGLTAAFVVNYFLAAARGRVDRAASGPGIEAWRWMYLMQALPAAIFLVALFFIPESPRYLVSKGRDEQATSVLTSLFGSRRRARQARRNPRDLQRRSPSAAERLLKRRAGCSASARSSGSASCSPCSSSSSASTSSSTTARRCGSWPASPRTQSLLINIVSGAVSIAACFVTIAVIDKIGRKPLLLIGSAGMAVTLFAMVYAFSHGIARCRRAISSLSSEPRHDRAWSPPTST